MYLALMISAKIPSGHKSIKNPKNMHRVSVLLTDDPTIHPKRKGVFKYVLAYNCHDSKGQFDLCTRYFVN